MRRNKIEILLACCLTLAQLAFAAFLAAKGGADQKTAAERHAAALSNGREITLALSDLELQEASGENRCRTRINVKRLFWNDAPGDRCCVLSGTDGGRYALGETRKKPPGQGLWVALDSIAKAYDAYCLSLPDSRALIESVGSGGVLRSESHVFFEEEAVAGFTLCARVYEGEIVFTGLSCGGTVYPLTEENIG